MSPRIPYQENGEPGGANRQFAPTTSGGTTGAGVGYDPFKHHRRSIRLKGFDYRQVGAYYVTVVTRDRECLFGDIVGGEMSLNEFGGLVKEEWLRTAEVRPNVGLDAYVVMPNHLHGIIVITEEEVGANRRFAPTEPRFAPTGDPQALDVVGDVEDPGNGGANRRFAPPQRRSPLPGSLAAIMMQFKSIVTKRINAMRDTQGAPVWQRNYHEHIIRDDEDLNRIRAYIRDNPAQWEYDTENPERAV